MISGTTFCLRYSTWCFITIMFVELLSQVKSFSHTLQHVRFPQDFVLILFALFDNTIGYDILQLTILTFSTCTVSWGLVSYPLRFTSSSLLFAMLKVPLCQRM